MRFQKYPDTCGRGLSSMFELKKSRAKQAQVSLLAKSGSAHEKHDI